MGPRFISEGKREMLTQHFRLIGNTKEAKSGEPGIIEVD
jgi:hypothetical protein